MKTNFEISQELMTLDAKVLKDNINSKFVHFSIPEGYFNQLEDEILSQTSLISLSANKHELPVDYFECMEEDILNKVTNLKKSNNVFFLAKQNFGKIAALFVVGMTVLSIWQYQDINNKQKVADDSEMADLYITQNADDLEIESLFITALLDETDLEEFEIIPIDADLITNDMIDSDIDF